MMRFLGRLFNPNCVAFGRAPFADQTQGIRASAVLFLALLPADWYVNCLFVFTRIAWLIRKKKNTHFHKWRTPYVSYAQHPPEGAESRAPSGASGNNSKLALRTRKMKHSAEVSRVFSSNNLIGTPQGF